MKKNFLLLMSLFIFYGCFTKMYVRNDAIDNFLDKRRNFDKEEIQKFKVNGAFIFPRLENGYIGTIPSANLMHDPEKYKYIFRIMAFTEEDLEYMRIYSYEIKVKSSLGDKRIYKNLDEKFAFEPSYYISRFTGKRMKYSGYSLIDGLILKLNKKSEIEVILDVGIKSAAKEERKTLKVKYYYEKIYDSGFSV